MSTVALHIKHAGKVYDVDANPESEGLVLKQHMEALTGVPVPRQKFLVKGKQLQDSTVLASLGLKSGQTLMMLGSKPPAQPAADAAAGTAGAAAIPVPGPDVEMGGVEQDAYEDEDELNVPTGLQNIGNTCYANSALEALHTVPELDAALQKYQGSDDLLRAWGQLSSRFGEIRSGGAVAPVPQLFIALLRRRFPQFAETTAEGFPKQQDAEELWTNLMWELRGSDNEDIRRVVPAFDGTFEVHTNKPTGLEVSTAEFTKLMCHITIRTNHMKEGLKASLHDQLETGENTGEHYDVTKRISRLPKYLTVQFVRFFWRKDTNKNSKIMRKVSFPLQLDIGDLCTDDLQAKISPARRAFRALEGAIEESKRAARRARFHRLDAVPQDTTDEPGAQERVRLALEAEKREAERDQQHLEALQKEFADAIDPGLAADETCSPHGLYELQAIVTHQGMSADSGHYQCFTRNPQRANSWWRFNDDKVTEVDDNRIGQLAGGGASDSALILLYKSASSDSLDLKPSSRTQAK